MTPRQRLRILLDGDVPDVPPTWELVFQIEKTFFGMDAQLVRERVYATDDAARDAMWSFTADVYQRLVDEQQWAAVPAGYDPHQVELFRRRGVGARALLAGYEGDGVFWMPSGEKIMDFVVRMFEQPEDMHAEARRKCDSAKQTLTRHRDAGADFIVGTYDFGYNDAPFISPDHFRQFVTPYLAELVDHAHALGLKMLLHSDGCLTRILDQIHATGIDGYQSIDPQGHMDLREVRRRYPDWLLMGNVSCALLQDADEPAIRRAVRECMTHGGVGRRYIFSTSNCIYEGMPPASYRLMMDEYRRICAEAQVLQS